MAPSELETRARRAYELGRLRRGLKLAALLSPLGLASALLCGAPLLSLAAVVALCSLVTVLTWRGLEVGRAVLPGLVAAGPAVLAPLLVRGAGHGCAASACLPVCLAACFVCGIASGALLALFAAKLKGGRAFMGAAMAVTTAAGALWCVAFGASGVLGMLAGVIAASIPATALVRRASP